MQDTLKNRSPGATNRAYATYDTLNFGNYTNHPTVIFATFIRPPLYRDGKWPINEGIRDNGGQLYWSSYCDERLSPKIEWLGEKIAKGAVTSVCYTRQQ